MDAALWKQNTLSKLEHAEDMFKMLITAAAASEESPNLKDINSMPVETSRDKRKFAEAGKKLVPFFDENVLNDVAEILWVVPTKAGLMFYPPEKMQTESRAAIVKIEISGYKNNKFYDLALSGIKQSRIVTKEDGRLMAWIMPDISETQFLIQQTAKIIRVIKEQEHE